MAAVYDLRVDLEGLPVVDLTESTRVLGNIKSAQEMLQLLVKQLPKDLEEIRLVYYEKDWLRLYPLVHKLRGALLYCGVPRLLLVTTKFDNILKDPSDEGIIQNLFELFHFEIKNLLDNHG
ncbi:MAG: Hpt domain-containing protein [Gammaproteobacteria bacterium]